MAQIIPIHDGQNLVNRNKVQAIENDIDQVPGGQRDMAMVRSMLQYARPRPQANLVKVEIQPVTRQTKLCLVLMPKWAVFFAPYGIARLAALSRAAGYSTSVFDFNIETYHHFKQSITDPGNDPYHGHGATDFMWLGDQYESRVLPNLEPLLQNYLDRVIACKPDVVGFSMYYTNVQPTLWMARQIRRALPNTVLLAGGSQMQWVRYYTEDPYPEFDYKIRGEGEQLLLDLLDGIEQGKRPQQKLLVADQHKRIDLDQLPFPDYSDMDLAQYYLPNAISSELSRGCVAKCAFCPETLFWKYRGRQAIPILDEVEHQYRTYGTNVFWFIDSLVNGNINELRAFALGVVERGLDIKWQGYARCDQRMDAEYLSDLAKSGCVRLDYGIESGSQPVLDLMKKNIKVDIVERNMRDGAKVGIKHFTQWMTCFANERSNDIARSMTLAWRIQDYNLDDMARGTMNIGINEIDDNKEYYGIDERFLFGEWTTRDFDLTKVHRLIRFKTFNIFIEQMPIYGAKDHSKIWGLCDTYSVNYGTDINSIDSDSMLDLPFEDFDYSIIKHPALQGTFAKTVVNEAWPCVRTLWRSRQKGSMEMTMTFEPGWDNMHFGHQLASNLTAQYTFSIDSQGDWNASCNFRFVTPPGNVFGPWWQAKPGEQTDFDIDLQWSGSGHWD